MARTTDRGQRCTRRSGPLKLTRERTIGTFHSPSDRPWQEPGRDCCPHPSLAKQFAGGKHVPPSLIPNILGGSSVLPPRNLQRCKQTEIGTPPLKRPWEKSCAKYAWPTDFRKKR